MNNIKIIVATHKEAQMPKDSVYLPVHVGNALHPEKDFGYQRDDEGGGRVDKRVRRKQALILKEIIKPK